MYLKKNIANSSKPNNVSSKDYTMCIGELDSTLLSCKMIIFGLYLITFKVSNILWSSLDNSKNWLEPEAKLLDQVKRFKINFMNID